MNLCKHGHDKDVVGVIKAGVKKGKQYYQCRACAKIRNDINNKLPRVKASKWLYETKHIAETLERSKRWQRENHERYLAYQREYRQRVKRAGGPVAYFWQQQAKRSGVESAYFAQHTVGMKMVRNTR